MRTPDRVYWSQVQAVEQAHLEERMTLNEAVRRLFVIGMPRHEIYLRLSALAEREALERERNDHRLKCTA